MSREIFPRFAKAPKPTVPSTPSGSTKPTSPPMLRKPIFEAAIAFCDATMQDKKTARPTSSFCIAPSTLRYAFATASCGIRTMDTPSPELMQTERCVPNRGVKSSVCPAGAWPQVDPPPPTLLRQAQRLIPLQTIDPAADFMERGPMRYVAWMAVWTLLSLSGCATAGGPSGPGPRAPAPDVELGRASYYHSRFHGNRTASGERYDETRLTAAHRTLPFGTRVRVTNLDNGRSVVVTIVDRGPFTRGRVIDVSRRAARKLGFLRDGTARVTLEVLGR